MICLLASFMTSLHASSYAPIPAIPAFFHFFQQKPIFFPTSGPLHVLFPLSETSFPLILCLEMPHLVGVRVTHFFTEVCRPEHSLCIYLLTTLTKVTWSRVWCSVWPAPIRAYTRQSIIICWMNKYYSCHSNHH